MAKPIQTKEELNMMYERGIGTLALYRSQQPLQLGNLTPEAMVDINGEWKKLEKDSGDMVKVFKEVIGTKMSDAQKAAGPPGKAYGQVVGDKFTMTIRKVEKTQLDTTLAKAKLLELGGEEALQACMTDREEWHHIYTEN